MHVEEKENEKKKQITSEIVESLIHIGLYHRGSSVCTKTQWVICAKSFAFLQITADVSTI